MPWPPAPLPVNMTNLTEQQDVHPNLHNATAQAVNETVAQLRGMELALTATGANYRQTGQVYAAGQVATMGWNFRSTDRYGAGDQLSIPAGDEGLWIATVVIVGPVAPAGGSHDVVLWWADIAHQGGVLPGKGNATVTASGRVAPGHTISVQIYNSLGSSQYFAGDLAINRAAY